MTPLTLIQVGAQTAGGEPPPPVVGPGAWLMLVAFGVVLLVVPWLMTRTPRDSPGSAPGRAAGGEAAPIRPRFFTSPRERRLWGWALLVVLAIYATLSPAQDVAAALRARGLLSLTTGGFLLLVAGVLAVRWLRRAPGPVEAGAGVGVLAVYVATVIRLPVPEARSHLFEYGLLAMLIYHALLERRRNGSRLRAPWFLAAGMTAGLGWLDEGIQALLPDRHYDLVDVGLNAAFAVMALLATAFIAWARRLDVLRRPGRRPPAVP